LLRKGTLGTRVFKSTTRANLQSSNKPRM
jgi:hypothetical protein